MKSTKYKILIIAASLFAFAAPSFSDTVSGKSEVPAKDKTLRVFIDGTDFGKPIKTEFILKCESSFMEIMENLSIQISVSEAKDGKYLITYHYQNVGKKEDPAATATINHQLSGSFFIQEDKKIDFIKSDPIDLTVSLKEEKSGG